MVDIKHVAAFMADMSHFFTKKLFSYIVITLLLIEDIIFVEYR